MAKTYIDYDPTTPVGGLISKAVAHIRAASELLNSSRKALLAMDDSPATSATNIESLCGVAAGEGAAFYMAVNNTHEDICVNANVWQKVDQGEIV